MTVSGVIALMYILSVAAMVNFMIVAGMWLKNNSSVSSGWIKFTWFAGLFGFMMWIFPRTLSPQEQLYLNEVIAAPQINMDRAWEETGQMGYAYILGCMSVAGGGIFLLLHTYKAGYDKSKNEIEKKDAIINNQKGIDNGIMMKELLEFLKQQQQPQKQLGTIDPAILAALAKIGK